MRSAAVATYRNPIDCECGLGCTRVAHEDAIKRADDLCVLLGNGWEPQVWDNLGWHYCVNNDAAGICISPSHRAGYYYASLGGHRHSDRGLTYIASDTVRSPRLALRQVIIGAMEKAAALNAAVLAAVQAVDTKRQPQLTSEVAKFVAKSKAVAR